MQNDLLIYIMLSIYNMTPYSCFYAEMSIDKINRKQSKIYSE